MPRLYLYHPTRGPIRASTKPVGALRSAGRVGVVKRNQTQTWDLFVDESGNVWAKRSIRRQSKSRGPQNRNR